MIRPGPCAAVALGLLISTREAWADNQNGLQNSLFKVLAIAIGVVMVAVVLLVLVVKKGNRPKLPEARVHHEDTSASEDSTKD